MGEEPLESLLDFWALVVSDVNIYFAQNVVPNGDAVSYHKYVLRVGDLVTILD